MQKPIADSDDLAACRALLCGGSRSFFAASRLLPRRVRAPATALYAFCRQADDAIDLGADKKSALAGLRARLNVAYAGQAADNPYARAFAAMLHSQNIPRALPEALIEGLAWDEEGRFYTDFSDLLDYAARVAGSVGVMMGLIMGVRDTATLARAADLGIAMQLTNIARDVGEDALAGRLFLPLNWLKEAGISPKVFLAKPEFSQALAGVIARLLVEADIFYKRAAPGISKLPMDCRLGIAAARRIYAGIGTKLAQGGYNSLAYRARVPGYQKLALAWRGVADVFAAAGDVAMPVLPANAFLLRDIPPLPVPAATGFDNLLLIFERLERAQRENTSAAA